MLLTVVAGLIPSRVAANKDPVVACEPNKIKVPRSDRNVGFSGTKKPQQAAFLFTYEALYMLFLGRWHAGAKALRA